jgi:hypothetical protein
MDTILAKIEAHEEQTRRLNDELLAERDATQAKIEQLTSYRYELDSIIQRRGIRPNDETKQPHIRTKDPRIVKRTSAQNAKHIASIPVERGGSTIAQLIRAACSDGQKRSKSEIFDLVSPSKPGLKRTNFDTVFGNIGFESCRDTRPGAHHCAKLFWLSPSNLA